MNEETKSLIEIHLQLLKGILIQNNVSMATDKKGNIYFIDTITYLKTGKQDGFTINIADLVK